MADDTLYSLEFLFDGSQISLDDLKKKSAKAMALNDPGLNVNWQVTQIGSQQLKLSIRGSLEDVNTCHLRLNAELVSQYSCIRHCDEAGDEIRRQAYPILARIEQGLRTFINRAMTEARGFGWWDSVIPVMTEQRIRERVQKVEDSIGKSSPIHHPLELTDFDHLMLIVAGSIQQWSEDRPLSAADLREILSDCCSIDEVQEKLAEKTRSISLWSEVFAHYFENEERAEQWKKLEETITKFVIPRRNKVMHHRPMYLWELQKLQEIEQEVHILLASAKRELSKEERIEVHQISEAWSRAWVRRIDELARPRALEAFERIASQQEEWSRMMAELARPRALEAFERIVSQQEEWSRMMAELARPRALEAFERIASQQEEWSRMIAELARPRALEAFEGIARQQEEWSRRIAELSRPRALESILELQEQIGRATQQMTELPTPDTAYVGSTNSVGFHLPTCRHARRILPENLICFADREEALAKGYVPCGTCRP